eukprot:scaffold118653_cov63-Phaeocystis_antarctica.AAC.1
MPHQEPVAAALARLSKAQAKCAKELKALSKSHAASPAWASSGIAAVVRLCHDPASAAAAAATLGRLTKDDTYDDRIREAGAVLPLVALLSGGLESDAANRAAGVLGNLAYGDEASRVAMVEAGAVPLLVALLSGGPESDVAGRAAATLANLASDDDDANQAAITEAGAIALLVALLSGGPESEAAGSAALALRNLSSDDEAEAAVIEAGAVPPLVALLSGGLESKAAGRAAEALLNLTFGANPTAVLEEVARTQASCSPWSDLQVRLHECASALLKAAEEGTDVAALERAITLATAGQVDAAVIEHAQKRLREINGDAERQERRESFGLGSLELPDEFVCPITMDKMRGAAAALDTRIARAPPPQLPRLRRRPSGGVRRPLIRAVRHTLGASRWQRLEPAHPRAAPAKRAHPEPQPKAAHAGARGGHTACGGHRYGKR